MAIDTDIQSFTEYNANVTDMNNKLNAFWSLVGQTPTSADTNKVVIERSNIWKYEGEERYNGLFQLYGNISGNLSLSINSSTGRTAILATIIGNTFITDFGANIVTGVIYTLFLKQDAIGNHSVRWPYGASILNSVHLGADEITVVQLIKMPNGLFFIKCEAFTEAILSGFVIKEFAEPNITYPDGSQAPMSFTWAKSPAVPYGGTLTGLYSDWEIASDELYATLLFSSYNNTINTYTIQVVLTQAGQVYMRTRYGGVIGGSAVVSSWDEIICDISSISDGDRYWDQTVLLVNASGYEGSKNIGNEKIAPSLTVAGDVKISTISGKPAIKYDGAADSVHTGTYRGLILAEDFTIESYFYCTALRTDTWGNAIYSQYDYGTESTNRTIISIFDTGVLRFQRGSLILDSTVQVPLNQIVHVAVTRNGPILRAWLNGTKVIEDLNFSGTLSNVYSSIGSVYYSGYNSVFNGYIFSVRVTRNICRYDSDFPVDLTNPYFKIGNLWWTPEPKQIESSFAEETNWDTTELVINGYGISNSVVFKDDALNKAITVGGNAKIDVASNLSSIIFDGNGDYLHIGSVGDYNFLHNGLHNWTAEFWFKPDVVSNDGIFDTTNGGTQYNGICLYFHASSGKLVLMLSNSSASTTTSYLYGELNYVFVAGTMYHVAITLDWSLSTDNAKMFVNGVQQATLTKNGYAPALGNSVNPLMLGGFGTAYPTYMFTGRIYSFRISRFLRYTGTFTVDATRPYFITKPKVENWAETTLLINALALPVGSTDIRDSKGNIFSLYGDTKVGVDSNGLEYINFDGTGDYLQFLSAFSSSGINFGTADYTIDLFFSTTSIALAEQVLFGNYTTWSSSVGLLIELRTSDIRFYAGNSLPISIISSTGVIAAGSLYRVTVCCASGTTRLFVNGVLIGSSAVVSSISNAAAARIGADPQTGGSPLSGKVYSVRVIKGKALYTSNFVVDLTNPYLPTYENALADLWLDGNDYSKMTIATGVSKIVDKSGNMREAVQAATASQPTLVQNVQNGLMALNFDGSDDSLGGFSVPQKMGSYVVAIVDTTNLQTGDRVLLNRENSGSVPPHKPALYLGGSSLDKKPSIFWGTTWSVTYPTAVVGKSIMVFRLDTTVSISVDGADPVTASNANTVLDNWIAINSSSVQQSNMKLMELFIFNTIFTDSWLKIIQGYAAHKWGLTGNLPAVHPYKTGFPVEDSRTDDYWYAASFCLNGTDIIRPTEIVDSSRNHRVLVGDGASVLSDSNAKPYVNFDGTNDYLSAPVGDFGTDNFTLEFFAQRPTLGNNFILWDSRTADMSTGGFAFYVRYSNKLTFGKSDDGSTYTPLEGTVSVGTELSHFCLVRNGNVFSLYVNGVFSGSVTVSKNFTLKTARIGQQYTLLSNSPGKIYSMRITRGIARYTSDFNVDLTNPYFPKKQALSTPMPLKPDGWYDAADSTTITITDLRVSDWADKSGNGYHAQMATPAYRPVLTEEAFNGKDAIYFDGATRFLQIYNVLGKPANWSVFVVGVFHSQSSKTNMLGSGPSSGASKNMWGDIGVGRTANDGKVEYSIGDGSNYAYGRTTNAVINVNEWFCGGWVYSGGNKPQWFQGGAEKPVSYESGAAVTNGGTAYNFSFGRTGDINGQYLNGNIAEILIFRRALTLVEIAFINQYLENKWFS